MKKLFSSAISLTAALALVSGNGYTAMLADAASTEICDYSGENSEILYANSADISLTLPDSPLIQSNSGELSYNYKDFTDDNNRAVYEALSIWTEPSLQTITVELPETISLSLSGLPGTSGYKEEDAAAFSEAIFSNSKPGIDSLCFDMPEIGWIDMAQLSIGVTDVTSSYNRTSAKYTLKIGALTFTPALLSAFEDIDEAIDYQEQLIAAVSSFEVEGNTRYEQIKSIHDTICINTYYDTEAAFASSAIGALLEPGVVCEGYSKGFKLICDNLDIPCVLVFGNYDRETKVAHMWNYVMMEDQNWYALDLTWDDTDGENGQEFKYDYFLRGSDSFSVNHTPESDYNITYFTYPELSISDYAVQSTSTTTTSETTTSTSTTTSETTTSTSTTTSETTTSTTTTTSETTTSTSTTTSETTTSTTTTTSETTTSTTTTTSETTTSTTTTTSETTTSTTTTTSETTTSTTTTTSETTTSTTTTVPVYLKGDFNKDGEVNVADLVLCAKSAIGTKTGYNCDYDGDGYADVFDVIFMRKLIIALNSAN